MQEQKVLKDVIKEAWVLENIEKNNQELNSDPSQTRI